MRIHPATQAIPHDPSQSGPIGGRKISRTVFVDLVRASDALALILTSTLGYSAYNMGFLGQPFTEWLQDLAAPTLLGAIFIVAGFQLAGQYDFERLRSAPSQLPRLFAIWSAAITLLIVVAFLAKSSATYSRGWLLLWWGAGFFSVATVHVVAGRALASWQRTGRLRRTVAIYGTGEQAARILNALEQRANEDVEIVGIFDDREGRRPNHLAGHPVIGNLESLIEYAQQNSVEQIIIAVPLSADERIASLVNRLRPLPADIELSLDIVGRDLIHWGVVDLSGIPLLRMVNRPLRDWHGILKAAEDRVLGAAILLTIAPLIIIIGVLIRLDSPGPILFRQKRFGFNNQPITVYKFRTMRSDLADESGAKQTIRNDPRVTRVGRILRRSSLDELPQFINVLQGRLSIVGPRPHALTMHAADKPYHEAVSEYAIRHRVKPGITGWAQVNGLRGETDTIEKATKRVTYDLYYIENWSLLFDLKIILLTIHHGFRDPNAY